MIRIGMRFLFDDLAHDHLIVGGASDLDTFNARAGQVQTIAKRLQISRYLNIFT